jgi:hypothetical protein
MQASSYLNAPQFQFLMISFLSNTAKENDERRKKSQAKEKDR